MTDSWEVWVGGGTIDRRHDRLNIGSGQEINLAGSYVLKDCFQVATKSLFLFL